MVYPDAATVGTAFHRRKPQGKQFNRTQDRWFRSNFPAIAIMDQDAVKKENPFHCRN
jgi:hypothetical protein